MDWYADIVATIALGLSGRAFLQERKAKLEPQLDLEPLPAAHQMALRITSSARWMTVRFGSESCSHPRIYARRSRP
jgi:hypothetical protein